jgi:hypothetical protein
VQGGRLNTKKLCIWAILLFILAAQAYSQPNWVKVLARNASYANAHEDASAIILYKRADLEISKRGYATTHNFIACKILDEDGESFGILSQPISPFLKVKNLKGWVIQPSGESTSLKKNEIITMSNEMSTGYYDDDHVVYAAPSNVEPGSIVAFEWKTEESPYTSLYNSFTFQIQQPVILVQFKVKIPKGWTLLKSEWNLEHIEFSKNGNTYRWTGKNLPYQPDEPLSPSWHFLSRFVRIACFDTEKKDDPHFENWRMVANWISKIHDKPAQPDQSVYSKTQQITAGLKTIDDKLRAISTYCQNEIRYVAVELGKGRWIPRSAARTVANHFGDCKDKTILMRAMLKCLGIESHSVMANNHYYVDPGLPSPYQFNHCLIAIPSANTINRENYSQATVAGMIFFDPTDQSCDIGELPSELHGARVLVCADHDTVLYRLPIPGSESTQRIFYARVLLNENGSFHAKTKVREIGSFASQARLRNRSGSKEDQIENWLAFFSDHLHGAEISNLAISENADTMTTTFSLGAANILQRAGPLVMFRPDIFMKSLTSQLSASKRIHPIWMGSPSQIKTHVEWELPEKWHPEVDTTEIKNHCKGASISSRTKIDGNALIVKTAHRRYGKLMWQDEYENARSFWNDLNRVKEQTAFIKTE